uniref:Uncharacterized protein n=1 Tax=Strongyloides venezuelensis TaxID=75913 RepID=A0A0K0G681_STRVS
MGINQSRKKYNGEARNSKKIVIIQSIAYHASKILHKQITKERISTGSKDYRHRYPWMCSRFYSTKDR